MRKLTALGILTVIVAVLCASGVYAQDLTPEQKKAMMEAAASAWDAASAWEARAPARASAMAVWAPWASVTEAS